jgi:hypothetical protein
MAGHYSTEGVISVAVCGIQPNFPETIGSIRQHLMLLVGFVHHG